MTPHRHRPGAVPPALPRPARPASSAVMAIHAFFGIAIMMQTGPHDRRVVRLDGPHVGRSLRSRTSTSAAASPGRSARSRPSSWRSRSRSSGAAATSARPKRRDRHADRTGDAGARGVQRPPGSARRARTRTSAADAGTRGRDRARPRGRTGSRASGPVDADRMPVPSGRTVIVAADEERHVLADAGAPVRRRASGCRRFDVGDGLGGEDGPVRRRPARPRRPGCSAMLPLRGRPSMRSGHDEAERTRRRAAAPSGSAHSARNAVDPLLHDRARTSPWARPAGRSGTPASGLVGEHVHAGVLDEIAGVDRDAVEPRREHQHDETGSSEVGLARRPARPGACRPRSR